MELDPSTPSRMPRRQTLHTFHSPQNIPITAQRIPTVRRETTFPYQAHQPRKSLTSVPTAERFIASSVSPQKISPYAVSRRSSVALDSSSPLQRTSMVGSYEESILRGRMSTSPSKPLDFLAQIGVLGLGNCKSSLRCPAHVTLPFPAVFYSYASTPHGRSKSDDGPSPYVGSIDLENGLPSNLEGSRARRRSGQRERGSGRRSRAGSVGPDVEMGGVDDSTSQRVPDSREMAKKRRRAGSSSPRAPPGGSYRIPEKGQIQIIIKNQNKTAVKLFLVPYDLAGMEAGTKTFIRQRAYVGGPVAADKAEATTTTTNTTTDITGTTTMIEAAEEKEEKPVLRYLVHLHICCPAKGRFYLYKSVRVVFANRVPDGKERLRNEITLPEPRFTPYKATRVMQQHQYQHLHPHARPTPSSLSHQESSGRGFSFAQVDTGHLMSDLPAFELRRRAASVQDHGETAMAAELTAAPMPPVAGFVPLNFSKKGEVGLVNGAAAGLGGLGAAASGGVAAAESLLSMRLRSLGMQGACRGEMDTEEGEIDDGRP
ncbi:hypothetical protein M406DRAFT_321818 [Cryphonectria parasitica EP155]|uniref:Atos-like conserved domain-containing protein n=1 Tax=Cryphonectria parasitica (strain ATCC 38755 / EP155) TaxID=660469 RepID=A0A9P4Y7M9_CRYP1|nr:uncharacterized protein M406DRAFT_321818 [Cryphonectria parasitica EP155]KAF3767996.1 hypothetical protein M406DRAFT_321818 [Cryphonectria parasitica EP155]